MFITTDTTPVKPKKERKKRKVKGKKKEKKRKTSNSSEEEIAANAEVAINTSQDSSTEEIPLQTKQVRRVTISILYSHIVCLNNQRLQCCKGKTLSPTKESKPQLILQ